MATRTVVLGGTDWTNEWFNQVDLNDTFNTIVSKILVLESSIPPIGSIIAWHKSQGAGVIPWGWILCDVGAGNISDADSPINGQPIPALNGTTEATKKFIANGTVSGTTSGASTHSHNTTANKRIGGSASNNFGYAYTNTTSSIPPYFEVNFIMRYK